MRWMLCAPLRAWVLLAAGASLLLNLAQLAPSLFMLQVFDRVFASRSLETLAVLALGTGLLLVVGYAMDVLRLRALAAAAAAVDRALTPRILHSLLRQAACRPGRPDPGPMADAGRLRAMLASPATQALFDAPWLPVYLAAIAALDVRLGLAAAVGALLLVAMAWLQDRATRGASERATLQGRAAAQDIDRLLADAESLVAMGLDRHAVERWQRGHHAALDATADWQRRTARLAAASRLLRQGVQTALVALGAVLVVAGHASPGIMVATTVLLARALQPVEQLIGGWRMLCEARAAWARLSATPFAAATTATTSGASTVVRLPAAGACWQLEAVVPALSALSALPGEPPTAATPRPAQLRLAPGQCLAFVGPSGAGKSCWLRTMMGLAAPAAGHVRWGDVDLHSPHRDAITAAIGYLPQQVPLWAGSLAENVAGEPTPDLARVAAIARSVGLEADVLRHPQGWDAPVGEAGLMPSSGLRQRIGLARALYREPRLLVLDEPDAHLDAAGLAQLQAVLAAHKARGAIVVMCTHRRSLIALADHVGVVAAGGHLEALGPRDDVLARLPGAVVQPLRRALA